MTWQIYYDRFFDWTDSTRIRQLSGVESFRGADPEAVCEMAYCLLKNRDSAKLVRRAFQDGVRFTPAQLAELAGMLEEKDFLPLAAAPSVPYTDESYEEVAALLSPKADDALCRALGRPTYAQELAQELEAIQPETAPPVSRPVPAASRPAKAEKPRIGLLPILVGVLSGLQKSKESRCPPSCEEREPHYGYRYGRWYYGTGHTRGCQPDPPWKERRR